MSSPPARLRIGRLRLDDGGLPTPTALAALDELARRLAERHDVIEGTPELVAVDAALAGSGSTCFDLFAGQSASTLRHHVAAGEPDPRLQELIDHAEAIGSAGIDAALVERERLRRAGRRWPRTTTSCSR